MRLYMNILNLSLLLLLSSSLLFAQNKTVIKPNSTAVLDSDIDYVKKIKEEIRKIKSLSPESYFNEIDRIREEIVDRYLEHKKMVCNGEFSSIILTYNSKENKNEQNAQAQAQASVTSNSALTKEEKIACWMELKSFQIEFINNMYDARKKYLEYIHNQRLDELKTNKDMAIKSLENSITKQRRQSSSN